MHLVFITKCSSVVCSSILSKFSVHWELIWFLSCMISGKTFAKSAKSFDYFTILSSWNGPFRNICWLHTPSFWVDLRRTVCGSVCLSVEKITLFVKTPWKEGWAFMTGQRYSPLHVTEFCVEMQGKFKVGTERVGQIWCPNSGQVALFPDDCYEIDTPFSLKYSSRSWQNASYKSQMKKHFFKKLHFVRIF